MYLSGSGKTVSQEKPDYWKNFTFTMYKAESGIQKKYWKYVLGLFDEKPDENNTI